MVGPSTTPEERAARNRLLKAGFVVLVGSSSGLVALQADPTLPQLLAAVVVGTLVGAVLLWFTVRVLRSASPGGTRR
jgi:hypothetical protein